MHGGFLLPRKEVGLDLFFPRQMQENLKVRTMCGYIQAGARLQGG